ncbi:uncharacterized protein YALI1_B03556g [Yarrowia lipolytica]|uniref:Uncharacterized protein n=1 Tax=Yarrowia lipolytica TaxID=4952 RepID=A0A1D8N666_YARLL|nr:hypothetical protein YALI1_B03556g [Yarrowia lipolytica]
MVTCRGGCRNCATYNTIDPGRSIPICLSYSLIRSQTDTSNTIAEPRGNLKRFIANLVLYTSISPRLVHISSSTILTCGSSTDLRNKNKGGRHGGY